MRPGFTLIEAMAALAILALAIWAFAARLGGAADGVRTVRAVEILAGCAENALAELAFAPPPSEEKTKSYAMGDVRCEVRIWSEKTLLDRFVRVNAEARIPGEPPFSLFVYRVR